MKLSFLHLILGLWLGVAIFASCAGEHEDPTAPVSPGTGSNAGVEILTNFNINLPNDTRSLGDNPDEEEDIATADVLAFMDNGAGTYYYAYTAKNVTIAPGGGLHEIIVTARVRAYAPNQIFVVLANASTEVAAAGITQADDLSDAMRKITVDCANEWPAHINGAVAFREIPMYGQTTPVAVTPATTTFPTFTLVRMLARIDITLKSTIANFKLERAAVYNPATKGYLSYLFSGWNAAQSVATTAAVPTGSNSGAPILEPITWYDADQTTDPRGAIVRSIYTLESTGKTEADMQKGTAIVIGGYYDANANGNFTDDGPMVYYRCDIRTSATPAGNISQDMLRNHLYKIEIQSFSGPGDPNPLDAYKGAKPIDFGVTVTSWGANTDVPLANTPGSGTPPTPTTLTTDYDGGGSIPANGGTHSIAITSDANWEALIWRDSDRVTGGDPANVGQPLLAPAGFGGGASSVSVAGSNNGTLNLVPIDYITANQSVKGKLAIVFRDTDSGAILNRITIDVKSFIMLSTGRIVADADATVPTASMTWAQAMGLTEGSGGTTNWNNTHLEPANWGGPPYVDPVYTPTEITGCNEYYEGSITDLTTGRGKWHVPNYGELEEIYARRKDIGAFPQNTYWSSTETYNVISALLVTFNGGARNEGMKSGKHLLRCVR